MDIYSFKTELAFKRAAKDEEMASVDRKTVRVERKVLVSQPMLSKRRISPVKMMYGFDYY